MTEKINFNEKIQELVDHLIARITKIYESPPSGDAEKAILSNPILVANTPQSLDEFGYRIDGKNWWL